MRHLLKALFLVPPLLVIPASGYGSEVMNEEIAVMEAFNVQEKDETTRSEEDKSRHIIMFVMGGVLLLLISTTVALGVAMVVYGKRVFLPHMLFAGLSMTLALAHSVVALVWFFPF